jgi:hypothetical protein
MTSRRPPLFHKRWFEPTVIVTCVRFYLRSGEPHLGFARFAGAVPADATKATHPQQRELFKTCTLGSQYGITTWGLGARLGDARQAKDLLRDHRRVFHVYWEWISATHLHLCAGTLAGLPRQTLPREPCVFEIR